MSGTAGDVIRIAKAEVGYHEGYSGGHWNNQQKYSGQVPGLEWSNYQAWCATFAAWVFQSAGMPKGSYPVTASCALGVAWWKQQNRFSEYPAVGAQVFFGPGGGSHTGIVYAYDATYIYTVEGNTNSSGSAEGDGVYLKKRARRDSYVYGYGYPAYPGGIVTADPTWKNPTTPVVKEQDMQLSDQITIGSWIPQHWPDDKGLADRKIPVDLALGSGYAHARIAHENSDQIISMLAKMQAQEAAQTAAITAMASALGKVDAAIDVPALVAQVKAAVDQGVTKALDGITIQVTTDTKDA